MAGEDTDIDDDAEATEGAEEGASKSKLPIIIVAILVLGIGGYFATPYIMNMISPPAETDSESLEANAASKHEAGKKNKGKPALFTSLHPPLVVNFKDSFGDAHFMQITLEVMAREQGVLDQVKNYVAVIRNGLILQFGSVDYDFVTTREGKEAMLAGALAEIQTIIKDETGETGIEAVFFTSLIIQ